MLSTQEVRSIHEELAREFAASNDPISPPGVRSEHLLESAVARQHVGYEGRLKYDTPHRNAATLAFGLCMNHPFFNGNKRSALVSLLCHLDRNDHTFHEDVSQGQLYDLMIDIAKHEISTLKTVQDQTDQEVEAIAQWIRRHTRRIEKGERVITFRELRSIMESYGFIYEDHRNNTVDLVRYRETKDWFGLRKRTERVRYMRIPYPGNGQVAGKSLIKEIRTRCSLDDAHGCDSKTFYAGARPSDYFIARYKKTLQRLART